MLKLNRKKYFFLIVTCILGSCREYHRMEMGARLGKSEKQNPSCLKTQPAYETITSALPEGKFVIVYLHGLNMDAHECDALAAACQQSLGDQVIHIQPTCREGLKSAYLSIDEQAKQVVIEIKTTLRTSYRQSSDEVLKAVPINLFGYSQGGLVACMIAANHRDALNIKTIIAAHAPLSGTDVLENTQSDVHRFNAKAAPGLKAIGHPNTSLYEAKALGILLNNAWCKPVSNLIVRGVRDMRINSTCIASIKTLIREGKHHIPILLITGYIADWDAYFDFSEEDKTAVDAFIKAYALLTTRQQDGEHDLLIPLKRQLCRTDSFENITTSKDDPVYPSYVSTYIAEETIHCYNLIPIISDFHVNNGKTLFECKETMAVITGFIANTLGQDNNLSIEK